MSGCIRKAEHAQQLVHENGLAQHRVKTAASKMCALLIFFTPPDGLLVLEAIHGRL